MGSWQLGRCFVSSKPLLSKRVDSATKCTTGGLLRTAEFQVPLNQDPYFNKIPRGLIQEGRTLDCNINIRNYNSKTFTECLGVHRASARSSHDTDVLSFLFLFYRLRNQGSEARG